MVDYKKKNLEYRKILKINFLKFLVVLIYVVGVIIWAIPHADTKSEKAFIIYIALNISASIILFFLLLRKTLFKTPLPDQKESHILFISNFLGENELVPFHFFYPGILGLVGIFSIDIATHNQPHYWIYAVGLILWIITFLAWISTRKKLLKEYREATGGLYLSIY